MKILLLAEQTRRISFCTECPLAREDEDVCGKDMLICVLTESFIGQIGKADKVKPLKNCPLPDAPNN